MFPVLPKSDIAKLLDTIDRSNIEKHPDQAQLFRELVLDWINDAASSSYNTVQRVASMRQFARYLCAIGEEAYILPEKYAPLKSRAAAYLFTDFELTALFTSIDQLPPTKKEPFLNEIAPPLFRLIYTCGLRPNEDRELLTENINLKAGKILVTHTELLTKSVFSKTFPSKVLKSVRSLEMPL